MKEKGEGTIKLVLLTIFVIIGLVPLNLFLFILPEWLELVLSAVLVICTVSYYIRVKKKVRNKVLITVFSLLFICIAIFGSYFNPLWNSTNFRKASSSLQYNEIISYEDAKEDLDYMMKYLGKNHPACIKGIPSEVKSAYKQALNSLKEKQSITVTNVWQEAQKILSLMKDAHTTTYNRYTDEHYFKYTKQKSDENAILYKINNVPVEDFFHENTNLFSYETESWGLKTLTDYITSWESLYFLGFNPENGIDFTFMYQDGTVETEHYDKDDFITHEQYLYYNHIITAANTSFVSYKIDEEKNLAILTLTECNYNDTYKKCLKSMFQVLKEKNITNLAVDLRNNGGGNSKVAEELIRYLDVESYRVGQEKLRLGPIIINTGENIIKNNRYDDLLFTGNLYLLTSSKTFSSAMLFTEYINANDLGVVIGEAPGNTPTGYGEASNFCMPNSGIGFQISIKKFVRADNKEELENSDLVNPDIPCAADDVMQVLLEQIH